MFSLSLLPLCFAAAVFEAVSLFGCSTVRVDPHDRQMRKRNQKKDALEMLEKQRVWKNMFQKCWHLLAANVMCLSKAFDLITEIQKREGALDPSSRPPLSQGAHYLSQISFQTMQCLQFGSRLIISILQREEHQKPPLKCLS